MKRSAKFYKAAMAVVPAALLFSVVFSAAKLSSQDAQPRIGFPVDWSSRHVIYAGVGSVDQRVAAMRDPRFYFNWLRQVQAMNNARRVYSRGPGELPIPINRRRKFRVDWAMPLGSGGLAVGESPAKYSFNLDTYSCANDFAVYTLAVTPSATQANIIAFNNLYTGTSSSSCPNSPPQTPPTTNYTQPTVMWSYRAGTGASWLSPALSLDGTKIAFVEDPEGAAPSFDVLTWVKGQGTSATAPVTPGSGGSALTRLAYTTSGTGACKSSASNSNSSPYIDYGSNTAYIGADNGILYRISNVFSGTPAVEYCITVKSGALLTSPVYDEVSNQVFVSDGYSVYAYTPGASSFTAGGSMVVASSSSTNKDPIVLSPVVDTLDGFVYVFSATDSTNKFSVAAQLNLALTSQATADIGPEQTSQFILDGDFDNDYYYYDVKSGLGTLYACGTQTANAAAPALYSLTFTPGTGILSSTTAMSDNVNINGSSNPNGTCSALLDFYDGTNDRLFVGTGNYGATTGANLVTEWSTNSRITSSTATPQNTASGYWGGTTAFTVDNVTPAPQTTSIYFGTLQPPPTGTTTPCGASQYCAVKLTQAGLQ
ncbi:MAG TPA: hypothetical protein VF753_07130 [Terriglobales bacterium]